MYHPLDSEVYQRAVRKISKLADLLIEELENRKKKREKAYDPVLSLKKIFVGAKYEVSKGVHRASITHNSTDYNRVELWTQGDEFYDIGFLSDEGMEILDNLWKIQKYHEGDK